MVRDELEQPDEVVQAMMTLVAWVAIGILCIVFAVTVLQRWVRECLGEEDAHVRKA